MTNRGLKRIRPGQYEYESGFGVTHHVVRHTSRMSPLWVVHVERAGVGMAESVSATKTLKQAVAYIEQEMTN